MSARMITEASEAINEFMAKREWQKKSCEECGKIFFSKRNHKVGNPICGWGKCDKGDYPFLNFSKRKKMLSSVEINTKIRDYFNSKGFLPTDPKNVANHEGQTDLIVAGVQVFDEVIHGNQSIRKDELFLAQPCVRMQFQEQIKSGEGISTSFVNICTEKMDTNPNEHLQIVDHWFTVFSKLGLHMKDFTIIMRTSVNNWGTGEFPALELFFSYGGLEIGDASYFSLPRADQTMISISDVGFGLERIAWAINKTNSYFDMLTPWTSDNTKEMLDSCRTLSLLALRGVRPANKGAGLQFRRFAKLLSEKYYGNDIHRVLIYYFHYWEQFIEPIISCDGAVRIILLEIERFINLKICKILSLPPPREETTEEYLDRLAYFHNINIYELREAVKKCKA